MIMVLDVDYREAESKGHAAGILCDTPYDSQALQVITAVVTPIEAYQPGRFYLRELRCLEAVLRQTDTSRLELVFVDGYADFGTAQASLGTHVHGEYGIPVIGIAKNPFKGCLCADTEVCRGNSRKPLYVTCRGLAQEQAREIVRHMAGSSRLPELVKLADRYARDWSC